ncbi:MULTISPECIES: hypothetical protein [unclassified Actinobaculum]|uniref:hypothetical protein n=1 Tax=unclassified Actinobaculum TaxID=2609299 RepID=UPI000D525E36|nr:MULTISPECIES: hypothetical protein [unclassified Actinobaculum]AWE43320.1 hypothetical protein DDD63_11825 [Actinobaculum sp. 313]RTE49780.1 hypothetical protein EKN07_04455 [Actinobaculum sp. 352]
MGGLPIHPDRPLSAAEDVLVNEFAKSGQVLSGRYQLTAPCADQLPYNGTQLWDAVDTLLGTSVRVLVLDPALDSRLDVLDAARRSALVEDAHIVKVLSASEDDNLGYIVTEVPPGKSLATWVPGAPFPPAQAHALVGEAASALNSARGRGLRHLQLSPGRIRVGSAGEVYIDGLGTDAALAGIRPDTLAGIDADRAEARGLVTMLAALLTGASITGSDDARAALAAATANQQVPERLREICAREAGRHGPSSPADLVRELAPWPPIEPSQFPTPVHQAPVTPASAGAAGMLATAEGAATAASATADSDAPSATTADAPARVADTPGPMNVRFPATGREQMTDPELGITPQAPVALSPQWAKPGQFVDSQPAADAATDGGDPAEDAEAVQYAATGPEDGAPTQVIASDTEHAADDAAAVASGEDLSTVSPSEESEAAAAAHGSAEAASGGEDTAASSGAPRPEPSEDMLPQDDADATQIAPAIPRVGSSGSKAAAAAASSTTSAAPAAAGKIGYGETGRSEQKDARQATTEPVLAWKKSREDTAEEKRYDPSKVVVLGAVILFVFALAWSVTTFFRPPSPVNTTDPTISAEPTESSTDEEPSSTQSTSDTGNLPAPTIANVTLVNPYPTGSDANEDSPTTVVYAWDGDASTSWRSWWYTGELFANLKSGTGLQITLSEKASVSAVNLQVNGSGGNVQWRSNATPENPDGGDLVTESSMSSTTTLTADEPVETDTIYLWFTSLPTDPSGQYRIDLSEITVE